MNQLKEAVINKILAWILSSAMVFSLMPINTFATEIDHTNKSEVTAITLSQEIAMQEFSKGEENVEVNLPETILAQITETIWEQMEDGDYDVTNDTTPITESGNWQSTTTINTVELAVTWAEVEEKEFSTNEVATFEYTSTFTDITFTLMDEVEMPTITVNVVEHPEETIPLTELVPATPMEEPQDDGALDIPTEDSITVDSITVDSIAVDSVAELNLSLDNGAITITESGYTQYDGTEISHTGAYIISGTLPSRTYKTGITIKSGEHHITLDNVSIKDQNEVPIILASGVTANITVVGTNTVKSYGVGNAAISVPEGATLSLTGQITDGTVATLTTEGQGTISAEYGTNTGTITIGGNLILNTTGIGSADAQTSGDITIGGNADVTAVSGTGSGIGGGVNIGTITIRDNASVTATGGTGYAGIGTHYGSNTTGTILINTTGDVTATGGKRSAGIGVGGSNGATTSTVSVDIQNGNITAQGGEEAAGIGGGQIVDCSGTVAISGGSVTATGGNNGAGIGAGEYGNMNVAITGGTVKAIGSGSGADIGGVHPLYYTGTVTITGGTVNAMSNGIGKTKEKNWDLSFSTGENGNAVINTSMLGIQRSNFTASAYHGIFFIDAFGYEDVGNMSGKPIGVVYGTPMLSQNTTIPNDKTLTIEGNNQLTVPNGVTLTNDGTLTLHSTEGLIGDGSLAGEGIFQVESNVITDDMIIIKDGVTDTYNGEGYSVREYITVEIPSGVDGTTIMDKNFTTSYDLKVDNADGTVEGWTRSVTLNDVEKKDRIDDAGTYTITYTKGSDTSQTASKPYIVAPATLDSNHISIKGTTPNNSYYGENISLELRTALKGTHIAGAYKIYDTIEGEDILLDTVETSETNIAYYDTSTLSVGTHEIYTIFTPSDSNFVTTPVTSNPISVTVIGATMDVIAKETEEYTYDGTVKNITVNANSTSPIEDFTYHATYKLRGHNEYQDTQPTMVNAGTYVVDYKVSAVGHKDVTGSTTVTINKATNQLTLTWDGWTYPETAIEPVVTADYDVDKVTYTFEKEIGKDENNSHIYDPPIYSTPTGAGTYRVTAKIPETDNYTEATTIWFLKIAAANMTDLPTSVQTISSTYTGEAQSPNFPINPTTVDGSAVTVKYGRNSDEYSMDTMPSYTNVISNDKGYHIYYKIEAENHHMTTGRVVFKITAYDISNLTADVADTRTVIAGNMAFEEPSFTGLGDDGKLQGTVTYSYGEFENLSYEAFITAMNKLSFDNDSEIDIDYTFTVEDDINYTGTKTGTLKTTVNNMDITFSGYMTAATTATYGDTFGEILDFANHTYTASVDNVAQTGTYTLKIDGVDYDSTAIPTVGNYNWVVTFTFKYDTGYVNIQVESGTVSVEDATILAVQNVEQVATYTGSPITMAAPTATTVNHETLSVTYSTSEHGTYDDTLPSYTDVEEYIIWYTLSAPNHKDLKGSLTFTILQSGTSFEGGVTVDKVDKTYSYGDTITVKVTPKATGQALTNGIAMFSFQSPTGNQMALFRGDTQISEAVNADISGMYTMTYDTANKHLKIGQNTITAKYVGNDNMATHMESVTVTLNEKALTWATNGTAQNKAYDATTTATIATAPTLSGILEDDTVTVKTGTIAFASANVGTGIVITATGFGIQGADSGYYTISSQPSYETGNITKASQTGTAQELSVLKELPREYTFDLSKTLPTLSNGLSYGDVSYSVHSVTNNHNVLTTNPTNADIADGKLIVSIANVSSVDQTATIEIGITSHNYQFSPVTLTVKTVDKFPVDITATMTSRVYDGTPLAYVGTPTFVNQVDDTAVTGIGYTTEYVGVDGTSYVQSETAPTNAGKYNLIFTLDPTSEYTGTTSIGFEITKANATVTADDLSVDTGEAKPVLQVAKLLITTSLM